MLILGNTEHIGSKSRNLQEVESQGIRIPVSMALTSDCLDNLEENFSEIQIHVQKLFGTKQLIVRSDTRIEDGTSHSYAGIFDSYDSINIGGLHEALVRMIINQQSIIGHSSGKGILIQEQIFPEYSGVCFTIFPGFERHSMLLEYNLGRCDNLVQGKNTPNRISLPRTYPTDGKPGFHIEEVRKTCKTIEDIFNYPQDIEWGIMGDVLFIFQTRPITTLKKDDWTAIKVCDNLLKEKERFFYEKNELSEIIPFPSRFEFDLLNYIYDHMGDVYAKYGIHYRYGNFLKLIHDNIYIDREMESRSFFSNSVLRFSKSTISIGYTIRDIKKIVVDIKNILGFILLPSRIRKNISRMKSELLTHIEECMSLLNDCSMNTEEVFALFTQKYKTIFEISLGATSVLSVFGKIVPSGDVEVKTYDIAFFQKMTHLIGKLEGVFIYGNSLSFSDNSPFCPPELKYAEKTDGGYIANIRTDMEELLNLKNLSRMLTVLLVRILKDKILTTFGTDFLHRSLEDMRRGTKIEAIEESSEKSILPNILSRPIIETKNNHLNVSPGSIQGVLVRQDTSVGMRGKLVYVDNLDITFASYLDEIGGIISKNGGILSHLGILAREKGVPVLSGVSYTEVEKYFGTEIVLDSEKLFFGKVL